MTAYNPTEVERLIAEAREDDRRMEFGHWEYSPMCKPNEHTPDEYMVIVAAEPRTASADTFVAWELSEVDAQAIARTRNNLRPMADQLEALKREHGHWESQTDKWRGEYAREYAEAKRLREELEAACSEIERMRPVVEAAEEWTDRFTGMDAGDRLERAVEAYQAAKGPVV